MDSFFLGVMDFFESCWQFSFTAAINDVDIGPQTFGAASRVHSHVAAADNRCGLTF